MYLFEATGPNCFNNVLYKTLLPLNLLSKECFDLQKDRQNSQNNELPSSLQWSFDGLPRRGFTATRWMERSCVCCSVAWKIGHDSTLFDRRWIKTLGLHEQNMILHHKIFYPSQLTWCCMANQQIHLGVKLDAVNWASASLCYLRATILYMRYARALIYPYHPRDWPMVRSLCYLLLCTPLLLPITGLDLFTYQQWKGPKFPSMAWYLFDMEFHRKGS